MAVVGPEDVVVVIVVVVVNGAVARVVVVGDDPVDAVVVVLADVIRINIRKWSKGITNFKYSNIHVFVWGCSYLRSFVELILLFRCRYQHAES